MVVTGDLLDKCDNLVQYLDSLVSEIDEVVTGFSMVIVEYNKGSEAYLKLNGYYCKIGRSVYNGSLEYRVIDEKGYFFVNFISSDTQLQSMITDIILESISCTGKPVNSLRLSYGAGDMWCSLKY